jgi:hypothetical protein
MKKLRLSSALTDLVLEGFSKKGEMSLKKAAALLGCSPAGVTDFLRELVMSTKDPGRYGVIAVESMVQVFVEPRRDTALRRRMMRLPQFHKVERLPPTMFTLEQAADALKVPRRKAARLLDRYTQMGYLMPIGDPSRRGARWQRVW